MALRHSSVESLNLSNIRLCGVWKEPPNNDLRGKYTFFLHAFWHLCGSYHDRYSDELLTLITEELAQVKKLRVLDLSRNHVRPADRTTVCAKLAGRVLVICVDR